MLGVCFFTVNAALAEKGTVVQPIEEAALDELLNNRENRLIISFMAAWCGPCIDELPALNKLYHKFKDRGLKLVGISIDFKGAAAMQPIITKLKVEFPIYWYGEKAISKFNLAAIPLLLIIKNGEIVERLPGLRSEEFLEKKVDELLK
jgi:thiol-disulfide isomerase/thioredoxin